MISNNEKNEFFLDAINKEAEKQCAKIKEEVDRYISVELQKARKSAQSEVKILKKDETDRLTGENNADLSLYEANETKKLVEHRSNISNSVFDAALMKIKDFSNKYDYVVFMKKSIVKIKDAIGEDAVIILRTEDKKYESELSSLCSAIEYDDSIILGGCKARNERTKLTADDTLDVRFEQAVNNFYMYSNLSITL